MNKQAQNGCWEWIGDKDGERYGKIRVGPKGMMRRAMAHRISWIFYTEHPVPNGLDVLHHCDNPPCILNPAHLFLGTQFDNNRDMALKGRANKHRGEDNGHARFTWKQVCDIRQRYAEGNITQKQLSLEYNCSDVHISHIVRDKAWKLPRNPSNEEFGKGKL